MRNIPLNIFVALLTSFMMSSCSVIGDIFQMGMGFGIFISVVVVVGIIVLMMRIGKK